MMTIHIYLVTSSWATASYILGTNTLITLRPEGYDPNIKWKKRNYQYPDSIMVSLTIESMVRWMFIGEKTKDLINFIPVPAGSNLSTTSPPI